MLHVLQTLKEKFWENRCVTIEKGSKLRNIWGIDGGAAAERNPGINKVFAFV